MQDFGLDRKHGENHAGDRMYVVKDITRQDAFGFTSIHLCIRKLQIPSASVLAAQDSQGFGAPPQVYTHTPTRTQKPTDPSTAAHNELVLTARSELSMISGWSNAEENTTTLGAGLQSICHLSMPCMRITLRFDTLTVTFLNTAVSLAEALQRILESHKEKENENANLQLSPQVLV